MDDLVDIYFDDKTQDDTFCDLVRRIDENGGIIHGRFVRDYLVPRVKWDEMILFTRSSYEDKYVVPIFMEVLAPDMASAERIVSSLSVEGITSRQQMLGMGNACVKPTDGNYCVEYFLMKESDDGNHDASFALVQIRVGDFYKRCTFDVDSLFYRNGIFESRSDMSIEYIYDNIKNKKAKAILPKVESDIRDAFCGIMFEAHRLISIGYSPEYNLRGHKVVCSSVEKTFYPDRGLFTMTPGKFHIEVNPLCSTAKRAL